MSAAVSTTSAISPELFLRQLRSQNVFQVVRQLAQFTKTTGGGIALQRMHGAANVAKLLPVAADSSSSASPAPFMPWRISSALSKKRSRSSEACSSEGNVTAPPFDPLIHGGVILVNHVELCRQAEQALRVPDEQIAFGIQAVMKFVDQALLFRFVEIDHHIAAENTSLRRGRNSVFRL